VSLADQPAVMRGLAVQPVVSALLGFTFFHLEHASLGLSGIRISGPTQAGIVFGVIVGIFGVFVTAFGAYPALWWLLKQGPVRRWHALLAGALLGNVPGALIVGAIAISRVRQEGILDLTDAAYGPAGLLRLAVFGSLVGVASAAVFWWFAGKTFGKPA
jgi:hypothetical protein